MSERSRMMEKLMRVYGVTYWKVRHKTMTELEQILNCKTPEAARLLLGCSRKEKSWQKLNVKQLISQSPTTARPLNPTASSPRTPDGRFAPRMKANTRGVISRGDRTKPYAA